MKKTITLTIAGTDFSFTVTADDYNNYMNALMPNDKVAPAHQLVVRTVASTQKEALAELLESNSGAAMVIAGSLITEFAPKLEISVKK